MTEEELQQQADRYLKENKTEIIKVFSDPEWYEPAENPIAVFMAGSPGAGKTEVSRLLFDGFRQGGDGVPVRIDADEIRAVFPGYTGTNAHVFQKAATNGVHILFNNALKRRLNIILDGTFAFAGVAQNIERCLKRGMQVIIFFVFQEPTLAWQFTQSREAKEGRRVTKEAFINAFIKSRENVREVKTVFGDKVRVDMIIKDYRNQIQKVYIDVDNIDNYLEKVYTRDELEGIIQ